MLQDPKYVAPSDPSHSDDLMLPRPCGWASCANPDPSVAVRARIRYRPRPEVTKNQKSPPE
jgi:hypothetical protein